MYGRGKRALNTTEQTSNALDLGSAGYVWPGSQPRLWESAYRSFVAFAKTHRVLRKHPPAAFSRDVFLAWIGGNSLAHAEAELAACYPGYGQPNGDPDYQDPPEAQADPRYARVQALYWPCLQARARLGSPKDPQHVLYTYTLARRFPGVRSFPKAGWAQTFGKLRED